MSDDLKNILDGLSVVATVGVITSLIPVVAGLLTIVWTAVRIFESKTIQGWLEKRRARSGRPD